MNLFIATATAVAHAAVPVQKIGQHAPASPGLFGAVIALVLVLGLILGLAWLLKRMPGGGFRQNEQLRVVAMLTVGNKERLVVVEVGGQQLLLGVTAGGISPLHALPEPLAAVPAQALPNFAEMLAKRLRKDP